MTVREYAHNMTVQKIVDLDRRNAELARENAQLKLQNEQLKDDKEALIYWAKIGRR